ncbi:MAG: hypothetical protein WCO31_02500 [Actinomycetes bacterium]
MMFKILVRMVMLFSVSFASLVSAPMLSSASTVSGYPGPGAGPDIPPGPTIGPLSPGQSAESYACGFAPGGEVAVKVGTILAQTLIADANGCILLVINVFAGPALTVSGGRQVAAKIGADGFVWVSATGFNTKGSLVGIKFPIVVPASNLQGYVILKGVPRGYLASITVMACPGAVVTDHCVGGRQTLATAGKFSLSVPVSGASTIYHLSAGAVTAGGLPLQSTAATVAVRSAGVTTKNISFVYVSPTVAGTITLAKAPRDFSGALGVEICPQTVLMSYGCVGGAYISGSTSIAARSAFGTSLLPGKWALAAAYRRTASAAPVLGSSSKTTVAANSSQTLNLTVNYANPNLTGNISSEGLPASTVLSVLACPTKVDFKPGCEGGQRASSTVSNGSYEMWLSAKTSYNVAAGFPLISGGNFFGASGSLTTPKSGSTTLDLEVVRLTSPLKATVTVNNVPKTVVVAVAVLACPTGYTQFSPGCLSAFFNSRYGSNGDTISVSLPRGDWDIAGGYTLLSGASSSSNTVIGDLTGITLSDQHLQAIDLSVDYLAPSITGTASVSGIPAGSNAQISVLVCPGKVVALACKGGNVIPIAPGGGFSVAGLKAGLYAVAAQVILGNSPAVYGSASSATVTNGRTVAVAMRPYSFVRPSITGRVY